MFSEFEWLAKCSVCNGQGNTEGMGYQKEDCQQCKCRRKLLQFINKIKTCYWLRHPIKTVPVEISVILLICTAIIFFSLYHNLKDLSIHIESYLGIIVPEIGLIFVALKYKLDQANYHKDLFEKRVEIFLKIDKVLSDTFNDKEWRELVAELDSIYRRSYFLFSQETYQFVEKFRQDVINISMLAENESEARKKSHDNLLKMLHEQKLSEKFPELKIDFY